MVVIRSNKDQDTTETVKPFMEYLDSPKHLEFKSDKVMFVARLISTVLFWTETDQERRIIFKAKDLGHHDQLLIPLYSNEEVRRSSVGRGYYQLLSPLLYCMQLELLENEFIEREGLIIVNRSSGQTSTPHYYRVSREKIRICADDYFQSSGREFISVSHTIIIFSFVLQFLIKY